MDGWIADVVTYLLSLDGLTIYGIGFTVLLLCGLGLPIPEDITLLLMGYMTYAAMPDGAPRPHASIYLAIAVGIAGVMIGDTFMFVLGRRFGERLLGIWPFRLFLNGDGLEKSKEFLKKNGPQVLFAARFMPGLRSVVFFTSGTMGLSFRQFLTFDGLAMLISVPLLISAAYYWGAQFDMVIEKARQAEHGIAILIITVAAFFALKAWWKSRRKSKQSSTS